MSLKEEETNILKRELHPCPNEGCENSCFGKQCSQCHVKMINDKLNNFKIYLFQSFFFSLI